MLTFAGVTIRDWIEGLVEKRYKTVAALAKAVGMTESGFSRAMKAGTLEIENCLRLADETGEAASRVFDLANKSQVNELIERLYGKARPAKDPDAAKAAEMMTKIRDDQAREGFLMMMRGYLRQQAAAEQAPARPAERHR